MVILCALGRNISRTSFIVGSNLVTENFSWKRLFFKNFTENIKSPLTKKMSIYEADGKTVGFVINKKNAEVLLIDSVTCSGFKLANGTELVGSMILFPNSIISWHITKAKHISEESLVLFKLLEPKIDILVFGYGNRHDYTPEVKEKFTGICKKFGLMYEALPTENAIGVYNFLADERRFVAGALIPPSYIDKFKFDRTKKYIEDEEDHEEQEFSLVIDGQTDKKFLN